MTLRKKLFVTINSIVKSIHGYNLSSISQITGFLTDVIISSKTNPCTGSKKQKRGNDES